MYTRYSCYQQLWAFYVAVVNTTSLLGKESKIPRFNILRWILHWDALGVQCRCEIESFVMPWVFQCFESLRYFRCLYYLECLKDFEYSEWFEHFEMLWNFIMFWIFRMLWIFRYFESIRRFECWKCFESLGYFGGLKWNALKFWENYIVEGLSFYTRFRADQINLLVSVSVDEFGMYLSIYIHTFRWEM